MNRYMPALIFIYPVLTLATAVIADQPTTQNADPAVRVRAVAVTQQSVSRVTTQPANIEPFYRAEIRARVSGYVREVKADIGDVVKQGDLLAAIDAPEMQKQAEVIKARIQRLKAEEVRAAAGIEVAVANIKAAEAGHKQAEADVAKEDAAFKGASAEFERMRDLVGRGASEPRLLDEAMQRRESAAASRAAAVSAITEAEAAVIVAGARHTAAKADLTVAQAETQIAEAQLQELELMTRYLTLGAPFDGIVTQRSVNPGDLVATGSGSSGAEPLFVVSQLDKVRCRVDIPERDAAFVRRGDALTLKFPSFSGEEIQTTVSRTSQSLNRETRTMLIEADIPNPDGKFLPGMFGQATLTMNTPATASLLPARAVRFDAKGAAFVYVIRPDDTVIVTNVSVVSDDGQVLQLNGLENGQRVIDAHLQRFVDGQHVQVLKDETSRSVD